MFIIVYINKFIIYYIYYLYILLYNIYYTLCNDIIYIIIFINFNIIFLFANKKFCKLNLRILHVFLILLINFSDSDRTNIILALSET